jgi:membrane associated rhomboid family serine protease
MIALFLLGGAVESKIKSWQYLLIYFLGGFAGNLLVFLPILGHTPSTIAVGASAAISALVGLGTFVCPGKLVIFPVIIPVPFVLAGAIYFVLTVSQVFLPSEIAYPAHLGGMLVGALFGLVWGEHRMKRAILFILIVMLIILLPYAIRFVMK